MSDYLSMFGFEISEQARAQVAVYSFPVMPLVYYASGGTNYCLGLVHTAVPIDGTSNWPQL
jgi:hypothetical protein